MFDELLISYDLKLRVNAYICVDFRHNSLLFEDLKLLEVMTLREL